MHRDKNGILAQKSEVPLPKIPPTPRYQGGKIKLRWLVLLSSLPLFGIVAAFGIAPQTQVDPVAVHTVIENLALPSLADEDGSPPTEFWREERVHRGDTIGSVLARLGVDDPQAVNFLLSSQNVKAFRQLLPGNSVFARTTEDGELIALRYLSAGGNELVVERRGDGFDATERSPQLEQRVLMKSGEIESSLFAATDAAGLPDSIALQLAEIFASDIDFHRDLRKGDRFTVVYEMGYDHGQPVKVGRVLAAEFINQGKAYQAIYFQPPNGPGGYYTPDGTSLRKAFLRSPLEFTRITSGFTSARFHPILKKWRAHTGVDLAAPMGTRVKAVADGRVAFVGWLGGYGKLIVLRHQGAYSTAYGHLSRFAPGLHVGERVTQGEVIGYVGMTGLATGPHLHYEIRINGVPHNPLKVALPQTAAPITPQYRAAFQNVAKLMTARLELLRNTRLASLE